MGTAKGNTLAVENRPHATRRQLAVFALLIAVYALLVAVTYLVMPLEQINPMASTVANLPTRPALALGAGGMVLVLYGTLGLAGYWFARRLGMPGIFREGAGWRAWAWSPMAIGLAMGVVLVAMDRLFAMAGKMDLMLHPTFPLSIIASATAGIGEEILFRVFVLGLWAFLANLLLKRWRAGNAAFWVGNVLAALAFSAGHLPGAMALAGTSNPAAIPPLLLAEGLVLNSALGLVAGVLYRRTGFVAAAGVHFWADIVWHVVWPLLGA